MTLKPSPAESNAEPVASAQAHEPDPQSPASRNQAARSPRPLRSAEHLTPEQVEARLHTEKENEGDWLLKLFGGGSATGSAEGRVGVRPDDYFRALEGETVE